MLKRIDAGTLTVSYREAGDPNGHPVVLLHGFPYDIHSYDDVVPHLTAHGARVIVPYLRGFGPTRFISTATPRSGQQAALGFDVLALLDALRIGSAVLAGFDWGGTAACVAAALWPERVRGIVITNGYKIQDIAGEGQPVVPEIEQRLWYQYYFHSERGRLGLELRRRELCRLLWRLWSPEWLIDDAAYARSAPSFDNPDFVEVVIHSYRHRHGLAAGDPVLEPLERKLACQPPVTVPAVILEGESDGIYTPGKGERHGLHFKGGYEQRVLSGIGHNVPQEAPEAFARAVLALLP
ncbi:putative hydrolase or acyltransferase of alpha/beta superfamily [uncultured delta proteobacterium]|uniref:Putative hydrolase or acyltransferase of alpha/beta superfamily n=1 Tax=uncultured delta proteobacterium TaxID=34034 RepID=A0A212JJW5_9DELT|nr:putative hydrolase or acyltransferase of alpha/beta superfamily [uncultured delta proteobacterium]